MLRHCSQMVGEPQIPPAHNVYLNIGEAIRRACVPCILRYGKLCAKFVGDAYHSGIHVGIIEIHEDRDDLQSKVSIYASPAKYKLV